MTDRIGQQFGNYRLTKLLGHGGFADVYLGEHLHLDMKAAVKVLHVQMTGSNLEQFRQEARTIAHLQHPHIVRVLDFGIEDTTPFLVIDYAPGGTLRAVYPKGTRLPLERVIVNVKQVASALQYAHEQQLIHRDVKPENMLLNTNNEVMLSDFGLAVVQRATSSISTQNQAGTPIYMAPEQIQGKPRAASDQYALGVVVYEWLCGEPPFHGSVFEVWSQHLHRPPPSLREMVPELPSAVEDAIFGALAKDPHDRFVSVQEFAEVLEAVSLSTQSLSAPPNQIAQSRQAFQLIQELSSQRTQPMVAGLAQGERGKDIIPPTAPFQSSLKGMTKRENASPERNTNRDRLLAKVRAFWITSVLEQSLHNAVLIALGLHEQPDALENPWRLIMQESERPARPLPPGTHITQVYDDAHGELLILGEPGAGKTTLLLELARDLLDRAELNESHQMPVVLNLSSWAVKRQPLASWLVEELYVKYQVPQKIGQGWIDNDQVLLLLDGLDEVAIIHRSACVEAINAYRQEYDLVPVVVCSRRTEYLAQTARMLLHCAVMVQPLTTQQIDEYLSRVGGQLEAVRVALRDDPILHELATTPLMLSVLTLAYYGKSVEDSLTDSSPETQRQRVFAAYIQRMLRRRRPTNLYTPQQTIQWLTWLAQQLRQHSQTTFYIEWMQPDWLSSGRLRQTYQRVAEPLLVGLVVGLLGAAVSEPLGVLLSVLLNRIALSQNHILICQLVGALIGGPFAGFIMGIHLTLYERPIVGLQKGLITGLFGLVAGSLAGTLVGSLLVGQDIALVGGLTGMLTGMLVGIFVGIWSGKPAFRVLADHWSDTEIEPIGAIGWSWKRIRRSTRREGNILVVGLIGILVCSSLVALVSGIERGPIIGLASGLVTGLLAMLFLGLTSGSWYTMPDKRILVTPNQGIWLSARNMISIGLPCGLGAGLALGLILGLVVGPLVGLESGVIVWPLAWLTVGLSMGGFACIQHVVLRLLLWSTGHTPWPLRYIDFLDYATERILLRKVGGGYIFIHRLLLDYFASLDTKSPAKSSPENKYIRLDG